MGMLEERELTDPLTIYNSNSNLLLQMTEKQLLEALHTEIISMKSKLPNGELVRMAKDMEEIKEDISDLKFTLLNPEDGVIVKTNQNTYFRKQVQDKVDKIDELISWKNTVTKALWILFTAIVGLIVKIVTMS